MRVQLFQKKNLKEDRMDIYYRKMTRQIENVIHLLKGERPQLYGMEEGEKKLLVIDDIFYIDTVDKKTFAYLQDRVYQIQGKLAELEESLEDYGFCRISKSYIVNVYRVERVRSEVNMRIKVVLENREELVISRHYRKNFQDCLRKMRGILHE